MNQDLRILRSASSFGDAVPVGRAARGMAHAKGVALPPLDSLQTCQTSQGISAAGAAMASESLSPAVLPCPADASENEALWKAQGRDEGYERGLQEGRRIADDDIEQRAQSLAQGLVRQALEEAQRATRKQQQELQARTQELARRLEAVDRLMEQMAAERKRSLEAAEDDMLELSFEALCRVIGDQLASREGVRAVLHKTLQAWHGRHPLSVHLHPDDLALLQGDVVTLDHLSSRGFDAQRQTLRWVADAEVRLGGCLIRAGEGALDARLEHQLEALAARLVEIRASRKHAALQALAQERMA
ncbi:FliH/SctL family protein [Acidovorax sp. NCPPB 4044]|uniref:FliH/SctL family protein n=1 Tax=Acidovorax sp. NCPPB 4044 TaxID=2940490 RepID=UPI0023024A7D|nr:FliH/SctL family protein [Acidovorax sp. NCPPB 4044]MDA8521025.1 FliH/SctL family protein [Acidovorax sp. NCPPB 4044]